MPEISDIDDPRVAGFRNLPSRADPLGPRIIVESELAVRRLLASSTRTLAVLAADNRAGDLDVPEDVPLYTCAPRTLDAIVGFPMHRGAIALAERPHTRLDALVAALAAPGIVLCASGVSDPANLGSLARNARALGAAGLLIDPRGGDIYARKSIRTSMGNVFAQTVVVTEIATAIAGLKRAYPALQAAAATLSERAIDVATFAPPDRLVLIVGNEGRGVPADILALADLELTVPMHSGADSLNAAAASAVFLYALGLSQPR
jgi:tRNA G18 (ribose-2'-O)-methylase SpoU